MKKQNHSYAQVRIGFYEGRLQKQTNQQLVDEFNQLANSRGWTAERSFFSVALMNEMIRRDMDVSAIAERNVKGKILSVRHLIVRYDEVSRSMLPLM